MSNLKLARDTLQGLVEAGMEECVVCPGARNVPLMNILLNESKIKKWWGFEERSSAFFALGRIRATRRPVAVVTTSGTAAGELLPAAMEAYYTALPLVLLTADRPRRFRYANPPQSCVQNGLYGIYTPQAFDLEKEERAELSKWEGRSPLHLNVCFEEPEREKGAAEPLSYPLFRERVWKTPLPELEPFLQRADKLLVLISTLRAAAQPEVLRFVQALEADVYAEGVSGLRSKVPFLQPCLQDYTHVLRIGGVPTHRIWRDIEESRSVEVLSLTEAPFAGLSWGDFICCNLEFLPTPRAKSKTSVEASLPQGLFTQLSALIPKGSLVYLGNSSPIREWDAFGGLEERQFDIQASRGLNGIDGQISTFLGLCREKSSNWALLGDLTTLYDLAAPWFIPQLGVKDLTLAILNNRGGRIFEKMFPFPEMINAHDLSFEPLAKLWNLAYEKWDKIPPSDESEAQGPRLVEISC